MNTRELVHYVERAPARRNSAASRGPLFYSEMIGPARQAILCARQWLFDAQRDDGSWLGLQAGDASLASQLILLLAYLEREQSELAQQAAATILAEQLPSGGWSSAPDGPADVSTSVQAYFALKLAGLDASDERLSRARQVIRELGGADAADVPTRFFLALLGQVDYECCQVSPPESLLLGGGGSPSREALSLIWAHRPRRDVPIERGVRELFVRKPCDWRKRSLLDSVLHCCERHGWLPLRRRALERAEGQLLERTDAIPIEQLDFYELVWHIIALHAIGYAEDSQPRRICDERLRDMVWIDEDAEQAWPRLRTSPFADTCVALRALRASGISLEHPTIAAGVRCLSQLRRRESHLGAEELAGVLHVLCAASDCDAGIEDCLPPDLGLSRSLGKSWHDGSYRANRRMHLVGRVAASLIARLLQQHRDGGWENGPAATGAVLEAIGTAGRKDAPSAIERAVASLRAAQHADGGWESGPGAGAVYATSLAVRGMLAAGVANDDDAIAAGVNWLVVHQSPGGGWGESVSQTAWALAALVAAGQANHPSALRGVHFLLEAQASAGRWNEPHVVLRDAATGRWFRSDLHTTAEPLTALSRWAVAATAAHADPANHFALRLVGTPADR